MRLTFRKSSFSGATGCVEVSPTPDGVAVRDSKLADSSPIIYFTASGWHKFIAAVRAGTYNLNGNDLAICIKMSLLNGHVDVRFCDNGSCTSTDGELCFNPTEWKAFLDGVGIGELTYQNASSAPQPA